MPDTLYSIDGRLVPEAEALIPVTDRGFLYGDGLFETLHAYNGTCFALQRHLDRLAQGAAKLAFDPAPDVKRLARWLHEAAAAGAKAGFAESSVRLTLTRGSGPRGPAITGPLASRAVITVTRLDGTPPAPARAVIASFRRQDADIRSGLKSLNYLESILARREAALAGADEALLLTGSGLLCEGAVSNLALIRDGMLRVPDPARCGALPGITQQILIELAPQAGLGVALTNLSPWDPPQSAEALLTNSNWGLRPLVELDGKRIGSGAPGPLTQRLQALYRARVAQECG